MTSRGYFAEDAVVRRSLARSCRMKWVLRLRLHWRVALAAELKPGQWLAIVGFGGELGHLAIQFAKAQGLKVIGIDAREEGMELSKKYGAEVIVDVRKGR